TVLDEHVELLERAFVHEEFEALAGGELAALVLRLDAARAAAGARAGTPSFEIFPDVFHARLRPVRPGSIMAQSAAEPQRNSFRLTAVSYSRRWSRRSPPAK